MSDAYTVPIAVFLFSQTSWLVSFSLSRLGLLTDQFAVFVAGVICLVLLIGGPLLLFRRYFKRVDPLMCVFSAFTWSCMIDLSIGLELDGFISNFMGFYFVEGEPYLMTAHGAAIDYWDGIVHFALYLTMITLYCKKKSYREVGLYWVGTMLDSMIVLLQGGTAGNHPFKLSIMLNIPYVLLPLLAAFKFLHDRPSQAETSEKVQISKKHPLDLLFIIYFIAAIFIAVFRTMAVLGGTAESMKEYLQVYEPYLLDPTNFPKFQIITYGYFFFTYYLSAVYGLLHPGQQWMTDWSLIHAGAAAQAQFSYMFGACHHLTPKAFQCPRAGVPALVFWTVNLTLFVVPHLFAWWCLQNTNRFGRTQIIEHSKSRVENIKKHRKDK
ncbi:unnamed protein product [Candidula unifasciata]|uniref:EXPERA domain-containing protein n=1 Tax=Candidula unifasciata TaxID=100452 RepID=A0A8S4A0E9_9EUPU|nr:unnamed protein product [Candidula unifasciata]